MGESELTNVGLFLTCVASPTTSGKASHSTQPLALQCHIAPNYTQEQYYHSTLTGKILVSCTQWFPKKPVAINTIILTATYILRSIAGKVLYNATTAPSLPRLNDAYLVSTSGAC